MSSVGQASVLASVAREAGQRHVPRGVAPQSSRVPKWQPRLQPGLHRQVAMFQPPEAREAADPYISIPLGIVVGLLASFVQSLGLTIQRKSHVLNQALPEPERKVEHRRP